MGAMNEQVDRLLQAIRDDPRARDELLRTLLSDRFLELPDHVDALELTVRKLAEAQERAQQQLEALTQRVNELTQQVDQLTQRVDELVQRMDELAQRMEKLAQAQGRTEIVVQTLSGSGWIGNCPRTTERSATWSNGPIANEPARTSP